MKTSPVAAATWIHLDGEPLCSRDVALTLVRALDLPRTDFCSTKHRDQMNVRRPPALARPTHGDTAAADAVAAAVAPWQLDPIPAVHPKQ